MNVKQATTVLSKELQRAFREGDGCLPESDAGVNRASGRVVLAMHEEYGVAWIGQCNPPDSDITKVLTKYDPNDGLCGGSFVVPARDGELERLMVERLEAPYTGTKDDFQRIAAIFDRVEQLRGEQLFWT